MFQIHPDDIDAHVHLRQEIVQQGINASRHPGDLAGYPDIAELFVKRGPDRRVEVGTRIQPPGRLQFESDLFHRDAMVAGPGRDIVSV